MAEPLEDEPPADAATVEDWTARFEQEEIRRARREAGLIYHADGRPRHPNDAARRIAEERGRCREDLLHWLENYAWIPLQKAAPGEYRRAPLLLWPRQKDLALWTLQSIREGRDGVVIKGREVGATWVVLNTFLHLWLFDRGFLGKLFSRKEQLVDHGASIDALFGMLRWQLALQPVWLRPREVSDTKLRLLNLDVRSEITGEATTTNAGRGGRRTAVLFDEFARVDDAVQGPAWLSLETVARARFAVSTPNGKGNHFHLLWSNFPAERRLQLDWQTDPRRSEAWYEDLLIENGGQLTWDEREQEHACSFGGVSGLRVLRADAEAVLYDDDTPEWVEVAADARQRWPQLGVMDFGSGPSWTVFTLYLLRWEGDDPIADAWVDLCLAWQGEPVETIAEDIHEALGEYGSARRWIYGDPAGENRESDQESWISNLNRLGVPVVALDPWYNTPYGIRKTLEDCQQLLTSGKLHVHRRRAAVFWEAIEGWQYKVPEGVPPQALELARMKPRKDRHSHPGDTGRYGAGAIMRFLRRTKPPEASDRPLPRLTPEHPFARLDRLLGRRRRGLPRRPYMRY